MSKLNKFYLVGVVAGLVTLASATIAKNNVESPNKPNIQKIELPNAPKPVSAYEAGMIRNGIGMVSGQFPIRDGKLLYTGKVGTELSITQAQVSAELAALNTLAQISDLTNGFKKFDGLIRIKGYVTSAPDFTDQATVLNAASKLFTKYLGEKGRHARAAFSVTQLPLNSPLELTVTFAAKKMN